MLLGKRIVKTEAIDGGFLLSSRKPLHYYQFYQRMIESVNMFPQEPESSCSM